MKQPGKLVHYLVIAMLAFVVATSSSGCSFNLGSKIVTARPGTRLPGSAYTEPDGDLVHHETSLINGDSFLLIFRVRDRKSGDEEKRSFPFPPWAR
jgi:hypothetical protein